MKKPVQIFTAIVIYLLITVFSPLSPVYSLEEETFKELKDNFLNPPMDCKPHTRWWWMGNAVTEEEITWELEQMYEKGIGGVEQITMEPVYEKGNIPYMSGRFLEMLNHTIETAKRLGMKVSLNFGGPGWVWGGFWVPQQDRSKNMVPTSSDIKGPQIFSGPLPMKLPKAREIRQVQPPPINEQDRVLPRLRA